MMRCGFAARWRLLAAVVVLVTGCHFDTLLSAGTKAPPGGGTTGGPGSGGPGGGGGPGPAARLSFTVQPSNAALLTAIAPPVRVTVLDSSGNVVTTFSGPVRVAIGHDPSLLGATLSGTTTVTASGGVAVFGDLSIDQAGAGYTLTAAFGSAAPVATSAAFNVGL